MSEHIGNDFGYLCPNPDCRRGDKLYIDLIMPAHLVPDGSEIVDEGDHEWDEKSSVRCKACDWRGKVADLLELPAPTGPMSACDNCQVEFAESQLNEIDKLFERVAPGEPMPSGECPACGSLCHRIE